MICCGRWGCLVRAAVAPAIARAETLSVPPAIVPEPAAADVYKAIGVRPLINCRGTFTIIGGSMELPEVRAAKSAANQQYVQLDELMDAIGKRLGGAHRGRVGNGQRRMRGGDVACDRRVRRRRQSRPPRSHSQPRRLRQGRSDHPDTLAQRLRRRDSRRRREGSSRSRRPRRSSWRSARERR